MWNRNILLVVLDSNNCKIFLEQMMTILFLDPGDKVGPFVAFVFNRQGRNLWWN